MANLEDFTKFSNMFKEHIDTHNSKTIDANVKINKTDKIAAAYQNIKTSMDNLLLQYVNIEKQQKDIADTFVQTLAYMIYYASLTKAFDEYKSISEFISMLFNDDSELVKLLDLIENKLIVFTSLDKPEYHLANPTTTAEYYEWDHLKNEIQELLNKLFILLKQILVELRILPEHFELETVEIPATEDTPASKEVKIKTKGSRAFSKKFGKYENYFKAYAGQVNRNGYAGQKAKVYMQVPLVRTGSGYAQALSGGKNILKVSVPLMNISNIDFLNSPRNIIFGIFNIYDYVGKVLEENEDSEQQSAYHYVTSFIRFGGLFSSKNIDLGASSQGFRLNYGGNGWTYGYIKNKGEYTIDNMSMTCKFNGETFFEDISKYPHDSKICDTIDFYEEISSLRDNTRYKLSGELSYDENYTNTKNNEELALSENLKQNAGASFLSPTVTAGKIMYEQHDAEGNPVLDENEEPIILTKYIWYIDDEPAVYYEGNNAGEYIEVPKYVKKIIMAKDGQTIDDENNNIVAYSRLSYNTPKTKTFEADDKQYFILMYSGNKESYGLDYTVEEYKTQNVTAFSPSKKSYFKGTLKLESLDEANEEYTDTGFLADFTSSKEVILEIQKNNYTISSNQYESGSYNIKCYLDPDSQTNASYSEDDENSPTVFLPPIVSNFDYKDISLSSEVNITTPELKIAETLLALTTIDMNNFDELYYAQLMDSLLDAKTMLINRLLAKMSEMNLIITTIQTSASLFQSYDELYTSTYTEDIVTAFSEVQSVFQTYLSTTEYDIAELYNGVFTSSVEKHLTTVHNNFSDLLDDIITSESLYHKYENKLSYLLNIRKTGITFNSPLACAYDILSGDSTTITTMNATGQSVKTYPISYNYIDWSTLYYTIPYNQELSKNYFVETYLLQYLYVITQFYNFFATLADDNVERVNYFLRILLLRLMRDNVYNPYFANIYNVTSSENIREIIQNYMDVIYDVECDDLDFNSYYLNPYIVDCLPQVEKFNRYNINTMDQLTDGNLEKLCKALIYKAILEIPSNKIKTTISNLFEFLNNGQKLNIRELIFKYNFYIVINEMNTNISDKRYQFKIENYESELDLIKYMIYCVLNYRILLEDTSSNPILKYMSLSDADMPDENLYSLVGQLDSVTFNSDSGKRYYYFDETQQAYVRATQYVDSRIYYTKITEDGDGEYYIKKLLTLPKLLLNNYVYINANQNELVEGKDNDNSKDSFRNRIHELKYVDMNKLFTKEKIALNKSRLASSASILKTAVTLTTSNAAVH